MSNYGNANEPRGANESAQERWIEGQLQTCDVPSGKSRVLGYRLYLPPRARAKQAIPLLVMLHGCQQNARVFAEGTQMNAVARRHALAVLYPEQSRAANSLRCWNWFDPMSLEGAGEAGAIARLTEDVASRHTIDRTRIYVAGMSAGGAMARIMAVRYASMFAACAVHSGVMYRAATTLVQALATLRSGSTASPHAILTGLEDGARASLDFVPTLVIHGDRDHAVNPINAAQIVQQCRVLADAEASVPLSGPHERHASVDGRRYSIRDYVCHTRVLIRDVEIQGLGHAWSGGDPRHPFNDPAGPCASELIREFVTLHRRERVPRLPELHVDLLDERDLVGSDSLRRRQTFTGRLRELLRNLRRKG